jgi:lysine 2,3-aminomutase
VSGGGKPRRGPARRAADLVAAGLLDPARAAEVDEVSRGLALAVTPEMMDRMRPGDPADPLYRQFVPSAEELVHRPEELADPTGDEAHTPLAGIVHRHPDRVLFKPLLACPVYCRFCFRRETVGPGGGALSAEEIEAALGYIRSHPEIWEVIFTGGDPFLLSPRRLREMLRALEAVEHVEGVRFHTRVPVVDPRRVTPELTAALGIRRPVYVVVHTNHPRELTPEARAACTRLVDAGLVMLSQTVLLAGVNDDADTLEALFRALVGMRVKPYYLHHADLARGTGHLRTTLEAGQELMRSLRRRLSGLCLPAYVLDLPGGHGKVPVGPEYLHPRGDGTYRVEDLDGGSHDYPPPAAPEAGGGGG